MSDPVTIRQAVPADAPHIVRGINAICAERGYFYTDRYLPTPQWEVALHSPESAPDHLLLVAQAGPKLLGAARMFPAVCGEGRSRTGELGIFVLAPFRARGIGTDMMRALLTLAASRNYGQIILSVRSVNERAIRLYRKFGLATQGRQWCTYASLGRQEELIMTRSLQRTETCQRS